MIFCRFFFIYLIINGLVRLTIRLIIRPKKKLTESLLFSNLKTDRNFVKILEMHFLQGNYGFRLKLS